MTMEVDGIRILRRELPVSENVQMCDVTSASFLVKEQWGSRKKHDSQQLFFLYNYSVILSLQKPKQLMQGQLSSTFYILIEGEVSIIQDGKEAATLSTWRGWESS